MKLAYLGTPEAVIGPLKEILSHQDHEVVLVVSQPAKLHGRGKKLLDPPVAAFAKEKGIPVLQPHKARDKDFLAAFRSYGIDVAITASYGHILTEEFLAIPKRATINLHPSLLPHYRGATPVQSAIWDGKRSTGMTVLFTKKALDAGAIIEQKSHVIHEHIRADVLLKDLFDLGSTMLIDALDKLEDPTFTGTEQNEIEATFCTKLKKEDGEIDWKLSAQEIYDRFRAVQPWPGSYCLSADGARIVITDLVPVADVPHYLTPSTGVGIYDRKSKSFMVGAGNGVVAVKALKLAGKKELKAVDYRNGISGDQLQLFQN